MTTALIAIPVKMTKSARRFFGSDMTVFYPMSPIALFDQDQSQSKETNYVEA